MINNCIRIFLVTLVLTHYSTQKESNTIGSNINTDNLEGLADEFLKNGNLENVGNVIGDMLKNGGGKQLGDMLMNVAGNKNAGDLLQNIGSLLGQGGGGGGIDPSVIGAVLNAVTNQNQNQNQNQKRNSGDFDLESLLSLASTFMGQGGNGAGGLMTFLPMLMQTYADFNGEGARSREARHADHANLVPPLLEKLHVFADHFFNSDIGRIIFKELGIQKILQVFSDETGKFSYDKYVEMIENHSFRRHFIRQVTDKFAEYVSHLLDPKIQKMYLHTAVQATNAFLIQQGFPKTALVDLSRPVDSISAAVNHFSRTSLNTKINAKEYVKPVVMYMQDLNKMGQKKGIIGGSVNKRELSDKLADTVNLEVIEPIARVNRAYRFAKKNPKCGLYVMCLVNQDNQMDLNAIPKIKKLLYKVSSIGVSWFLSDQTDLTFWDLYNVITEETDCQALFHDSCNDFHVEEVKVTTEYVHNEL